MLLIKTYVASSNIDGLGLFLAEPVKKGTMIWKFEPSFDTEIPESLLDCLLDTDVEIVRRHAEYMPERHVFRLGNDGDIFMNHSDEPSLEDRGEDMLASRDLVPGDELTCDYRVVKVLDFELQLERAA